MQFLAFLIIALGLTVTSATPAHADAATDFVDGLGKKALSSLTAPDLPPAEREGRVRSLLRGYFDVPAIARFTLGQHWKEASDAQQKEYLSLFEDMIVKTYTQRFAEYSGQSMKVGTSKPAGTKTDTLVTSQIIQPNGPPVNVEWRVRNKGGSLKIVDVAVENVSMSVTQRDDFNAVIQSGGGKVEALLDNLKDRKASAKSAKK